MRYAPMSPRFSTHWSMGAVSANTTSGPCRASTAGRTNAEATVARLLQSLRRTGSTRGDARPWTRREGSSRPPRSCGSTRRMTTTYAAAGAHAAGWGRHPDARDDRHVGCRCPATVRSPCRTCARPTRASNASRSRGRPAASGADGRAGRDRRRHRSRVAGGTRAVDDDREPPAGVTPT